MRRLPQLVLLVSTALLAWLWMQIIHEAGHALFGWLTGGDVRRVVLHPLTISRTDLDANPQPLIVCWAGPVFGSVAPVMVWWIARVTRWSAEFWLRFFAGFCLIANGAYLAVGSFDGISDAGDLLRLGSPLWTLWLFGAITIPTGLRLWHGLGPSFDLNQKPHPIPWHSAFAVTVLLIVTTIVECWQGGHDNPATGLQ